ncbi:TetR/AcrR family transcriptional regulator [Novosphingobium colocasiae]|uniref:TetR/AcrR family transcriptional regulator n=1 Tax=Novosphingobium colocasiae TaxID=1256513 RepID=UPI0035B12E6F
MDKCTSKREENRARRRAAILSIAHQGFLDNGYAATSMSAIADKLGGSKTTLWSHFASKEELFNAVAEDLVAKLENDLRDVLDVDRFSVEALRRLLIRLCARLMTPSAIGLTRLVIGEAGRFPEVGEVFYRNGIITLRARLLRFFEGGFPAERAGVLMELTMCAVQGFRFSSIVRGQALTNSEIETFVDCLLENLRIPADWADHAAAADSASNNGEDD